MVDLTGECDWEGEAKVEVGLQKQVGEVGDGGEGEQARLKNNKSQKRNEQTKPIFPPRCCSK